MIPTPCSIEKDAELESLVQRLRDGDVTVKDSIILGFVKLAQQIALGWHRRTRRNLDILESEALYLLTLAVNKAATRLTDNNIGPYINTYISRALLRYLYRNRLLPCNPDKLKKLRIKACPVLFTDYLNPNFFQNQGLDKLTYDGGGDDRLNVPSFLIDWKQIYEREMSELLSIIETCLRDKKEQLIFTLRVSGHSSEEIGELLGLSVWQVNKIRRTIERRFREELGLELRKGKRETTGVPEPDATEAV